MSMNVSDHLLSGSQLHSLIPKFVLYTVQGTIIVLFNGIIFCSIWRFSLISSRKEYVLLSALAFADSLNGLACCLAGVFRLSMLYNNSANRLVTSLQCLLTPWNLIWIPYEHMYGAMLAAISVDRFVMLSWPLLYLSWSRAYSCIVLLAVYAPYVPAISYLVTTLIRSDEPANKPAICYTDWVYSSSLYYHVNYTQSVLLALASVLVYGAVIVKYRQHNVKVIPTLNKVGEKVALEKQQRLTVTLGFSSLFTFLFHIAPLAVKQLLMSVDQSNQMANFIVPYVYMIQNCNSLCNFMLYMKRHRDLRLAVKCMLQCKPLTAMMLDQKQNLAKEANKQQMYVLNQKPAEPKLSICNQQQQRHRKLESDITLHL